jgi:hypothetical protein
MAYLAKIAGGHRPQHFGTCFAFLPSGSSELIEGKKNMFITHSQAKALVKLGEGPTDRDFVRSGDLSQLLRLKLVYWRQPDELDFTPAGAEVYLQLTESVKVRVSRSTASRCFRGVSPLTEGATVPPAA